MTIHYVLAELLDQSNIPSGAWSEIPNKTRLKSTSLDNGLLTVDLNKSFLEEMTPNHNISFILGSFLNTLFQFEEVKEVKFTVSSTDLEYLNDHDFSKPFMRIEDIEEVISITPFYPVGPGTVIVIDAGHGGSATGAVNSDLNIDEKDSNLEIAKKLKAYFEADGAAVYMTRTTDVDVSLYNRYNLANNVNADLFVSIHGNGSTNELVDGTGAIYPANHDVTSSKNLADAIHSQVLYILDQWVAPYKDYEGFAVLNGTQMPAVITETGFITNDIEGAYLNTSAGQTAIAYRIYQGIKNWQ